MYFVYILKSLSKNTFYKGITDNLDRRLRQHLNNQCATTKNMAPWKLVFVQICENRREARVLEKYLKSGSGREIIEQIC
jgi:putative endonuclease